MIMNIAFPLCGVMLTIIFLYKLRYLRSRWSSARVWALCATVFCFGVTMWSAFPASVKVINRATGIPNVAELLAAVGLAALGGSFLVLALLWRYSTVQAWPRIRWVLLAYSLVIVSMVVLFALSEVPEERPVDFTFHYATHPTVAAMYTIYYVATFIGSTILTRWCFTWSRQPDYANLPYLRRGLQLYGAAGFVLVVYPLLRLLTMAANWLGSSALDPMGNLVPVIASLAGCFFLTAALVVPVWGPRWSAARRAIGLWARFRTLRSLHRDLREVNPHAVFVAPGRRLDVQHRIRRTLIELSDWRWTLSPLFDPAVEETACRLGERQGLSGEQLTTTVEAAQLKAALDARRHGVRIKDAAAEDRFGDERDGIDLHSELAWWCQVAHAYRRSATVEGVLTEVRRPTVTTPPS
ncbi:MAB_1171c family putative transporter [Actinomadura sp. 3N407]|uniref:MAB_1171c family putative transporter n=1 Tax=Actinomadura sp. 3N407 TaxID=3457423 RepID=UPI003FCD41A6